MHSREHRLGSMEWARETIGPYALLGTGEPRAVFGGQPEVFQRTAMGAGHGAGSLNIAKVVLARRIGISRTKERAAPTPATATTRGG